ncbi:hypothetical protein [Yoonia sp. 208BN28-4]|uniref:hypothetical protein n=1 Tax=Yoonia sp. 208BN28-4 TaxID=3126505 RepID=UPI00309508D6
MAFEHYRHALLNARNIRDSRLLIGTEGALEVRYAPFDHINPTAQLVILGITPGEQQANAAIHEMQRALSLGTTDAEALSRAKKHASFSGPMRINLLKMLDLIGVNKALDIPTCATLWGQHIGLVQFASALRYPVFMEGKNYTGSSPKMTTSPMLREQLMSFTAQELAILPNALVLPLGPAATDACRYLAKLGSIDPSRIVKGVPHPSGANGERIAYFLGQKHRVSLSNKTNPDKIDEGRDAALQTVSKWRQAV